jgi:hypothetical protein
LYFLARGFFCDMNSPLALLRFGPALLPHHFGQALGAFLDGALA